MKVAKDIMTARPRTVGSGENLADTISLFLTHHFHFLPVLTPNGEILGLLSEVALVKASLRNYLASGRTDTIYSHKDLLEQCLLLPENTPLDEVMKTLLKSPMKRVLVIDLSGQLSGIISPRDILKIIAGQTAELEAVQTEIRIAQKKAVLLEKEVEQAQQLTSLYREIFEASPLIMHSVDATGIITMANRRAHEVLGYDPGELVGRSIYDLYPHQVHTEARKGLEVIKQTGHHKATMTMMVRKDGHTVQVDLVSSALKVGDRFLGTITAARPVSESKALLDAIQALFDNKG